MKTLVFQGDSITDAGRSRQMDGWYGNGYPALTAASLLLDHPGELNIYNRGISGDRIVDVYARMKKDCINLKPDYLTILIGINDVWHEVAEQNGVDNDKFFRVYDWMLTEIKEALPEIRIYILEPFVLKGTATEEHWDTFHDGTLLRAQSAEKLAEKHHLPFIPLQEKFDELCKVCPSSYWLMDGVHPTAAGHEMIARRLLPVLEKDM